VFHETAKNEAYKDTEEQRMGTQWFGVAANTSGTDYAPGFMRTAANLLADN
jgi:hypothetical protein